MFKVESTQPWLRLEEVSDVMELDATVETGRLRVVSLLK
jgi:hypothetical protein